jgi:hypothetical protein
MSSSLRRALTGVLAAVALTSTLLAVAPAATAAAGDPLQLGSLTAAPTSGTIDAAAMTGWLTSVSTAEGEVCPPGFRSRSGFHAVVDGTLDTTAIAGVMRAGSAYGTDSAGINDGETRIVRSEGRVATTTGVVPWNKAAAGATLELRHTCQAAAAYAPATDPYYSVTVVVQPGGAWQVSDGAPVEKADTTTTLTPTAGNDGSVILTAAVAPAAATGPVSFLDTATGATVGTGTLASGSASATVAGLTAGTEYRFQAVYGGDAQHNGSESNEAVVTTVAEPQPPQDTDITVTIPASATGLKFTVTPGAVALSQATLDGTSYVASGTLGAVTVSDSRTTRTPWTLNGKAGAFVNKADPTKTFAASSLGWTPALVGSGNAGTAGAAVAAGANGGLSTDKPLAQAPAGVTGAETRVQAGIALKAPSDVAAGDYTATLTLTLI